MKRASLIRLGRLATMVVGVLYASQTFFLWPLVRTLARVGDTEGSFGAFYVIIAGLVVLLALGVMAIVALDAQKGRRYGLFSTLASLTVAVGVAMILVGMSIGVDTPFSSNLSALILIVGALIVTVGIVALGIATMAAGVLPWWCGAALIASPIFALLGPLGGVPLVLVGFAIFRAGGRVSEQPSRVR